MSEAERDLLIELVGYIDRGHDTDSNYCHPRVPEDCSPYCRACRILRLVADDVLLEARTRRETHDVRYAY